MFSEKVLKIDGIELYIEAHSLTCRFGSRIENSRMMRILTLSCVYHLHISLDTARQQPGTDLFSPYSIAADISIRFRYTAWHRKWAEFCRLPTLQNLWAKTRSLFVNVRDFEVSSYYRFWLDTKVMTTDFGLLSSNMLISISRYTIRL